MSSIEELPKPKHVTGGCLCGAVRYRLDFPQGHDFTKNVNKVSLLRPRAKSWVHVFSVRSANFCLLDWYLSMHTVPSQLGLSLVVVGPGSEDLFLVGRQNHKCRPESGMDAL